MCVVLAYVASPRTQQAYITNNTDLNA